MIKKKLNNFTIEYPRVNNCSLLILVEYLGKLVATITYLFRGDSDNWNSIVG